MYYNYYVIWIYDSVFISQPYKVDLKDSNIVFWKYALSYNYKFDILVILCIVIYWLLIDMNINFDLLNYLENNSTACIKMNILLLTYNILANTNNKGNTKIKQRHFVKMYCI
jgi:hypothetical protein